MAQLQSTSITGSLIVTGGITGSLLGTASFALTSSYALNAGDSVWTGSGGNIYYNGGNVGIGTTSPAELLSLAGSTGTTFGLSLTPSGWGGAKHRLTVPTSGDTSMWSFNWNGSAIDASYAPSAITLAQGLIQFYTTGSANVPTERMRIDGSGNVGIGFTSPSTKLDVDGIGKFGSYAYIGTNVSQGYYQDSANGAYRSLSGASNPGFYFQNYGGAATTMFVGLDGTYASKVGIGSTSPSYKLDVNGGSDTTVARFYNSSNTATTIEVGDAGNSSFSELKLTADSGVGAIFKAGSSFSSYGGANSLNIYNETGPISFQAPSATNAMSIISGGNVGIGTTTPTQKLDVTGYIQMSGTSNASAILGGIASSWAGDAQYPTLYGTAADRWIMHINPHISYVQSGSNGYAGSMTGATVRFASDTSATTYWDLGVGVNSVGTDKYSIGRAGSSLLAISSSGNVGIGATSPTSKLEVAGALGGTVGVGGSTLKLTNTDTGNYASITAGVTGVTNNGMQFSTDGTTRMIIASSGNVSIGTTTAPGNRLITSQDATYNSENTYGIAAAASTNNDYKTIIGYDYSNDIGVISAVRAGIGWKNLSLAPVAGNVGIGTTSPNRQFIVAGTGQMGLYGTSAGIVFTNAGKTFDIDSGAGFSINETGVTTALYIKAGGDVGIGTTSPTSPLSIYRGSGVNAYIEVAGNGNTVGTTSVVYGQDGSNNAYFWNRANANLYFGANNTTKMFLTSAGDLGIGTTSPSQKLEVNGNIFASTGNDGGFVLEGGNAILRQSGNQMGFNVSGSERMRITDGGDVGIGTTSPSYKLHVNTSATSANVIGVTNGTQTLTLGVNNSSGGSFLFENGSNALRFGTAGSERIRITAAGDVGIGTSTPSYKLDVNGRTLVNQLEYTRAIDITSGDLNTYTLAGFYNGNSMSNAPGGNGGWFWVTVEVYSGDTGWIHQTATTFGSGNTANEVYTRVKSGGTWGAWKQLGDAGSISGTTNYIPKFTSGTAIGNSLMYDDGTNIGIGTTSPASKLDVNGGTLTVGTESTYAFRARNGSSKPITMGGDSSYAYIQSWGGGALQINNQGNNTLINVNTGNVGIGTTSPGAKLQVNGDTYLLGTEYIFQTVNNTTGYLYFDHSGVQVWKQGIFNDNTSTFSIGNGGGFSRIFNITDAGNVGIGTTTPGYKLDVNGNANITGTLTATVKSFIIDHPTKEGKKLQYGVLEGPEHSVYVRGKLTNTNVIQLPDYWHALVHEDSITVNLTAIGKSQEIWVEEITDTYITVGSSNLNVNCFYTVFAERKDIDKLVTEFDKQ